MIPCGRILFLNSFEERDEPRKTFSLKVLSKLERFGVWSASWASVFFLSREE